MEAWLEIYAQITGIVDKNRDILFFRGHSDANWKLEPTLSRIKIPNRDDKEAMAYFDFLTKAGTLLPENNSSWNNVVAMQHHGMPTRLLDWTENFAVALYFAVAKAEMDSCIWILNPFELNNNCAKDHLLRRPHELDGSYEDCFIEKLKEFEGRVIAVSPLRHHPRAFNQSSGFTIHGDLSAPLEEICPAALTKIVIQKDALDGARSFLNLTGISEYSLFPDLDGLAREIYAKHFTKI